jgi:outer membrane protein assembly factor BamA
MRDTLFSFAASVVYDRAGTDRFFGIGNQSRHGEQSNFTFLQKYVAGVVGWNITNTLQLSYRLRERALDVDPGALPDLPSTEQRFPNLLGLGVGHESLQRLELSLDTRDDLTVPRSGGRYTAYVGTAGEHGFFHDHLYQVAGFDFTQLFSPTERDTLAAHAAWRQMFYSQAVPFWALSTLGGDQSILGENQLLRAYGAGRFFGKNSFAASVEYRRSIMSLDAFGTRIAVEATPFIDVGEVAGSGPAMRVHRLHDVIGFGMRGIASPFIVGYLDFGYGHEGLAAFTGLNYPF